jgi:Uma2 family endonuclease
MSHMTVVTTPPRFTPPRRFDNGAEWLAALGDVPLERIIFDPWPGTATEADLIQFVERDKRLCELIDQTLVEKPVGYLESYIAALLITYLNQFILPRRLGAVTGEAGMMRMVGGRVRLPDVAFVSIERLPGRQIPREPIPSIAPDLAVEILSESNTAAEIDQKLREYFQSGTRLAWVIDPRKEIVKVYHQPEKPTRVLERSGTLDGEQVLAGFTLAVDDLFRDIPAAPPTSG